ncbi:MAG TPA: hypothetical protein VK475_02510, partial [Pyrinomonadaceae bacterium]|nr:hypothetical protein [Pyrinomonadaceae bacterium]
MREFPLIILLIRQDQTAEANGDGNRLRAFGDEITGKTRTCIAVVKWSCAPVVGRLLPACVIAMANFCSADAADDPRS